MGDEIDDMELHQEYGSVERVRDWEAGAAENLYRVTVHRAGTPDLNGTTTQTEDHNLADKAAVSRSAYDVAASNDLGIWSSMTAGEKTDSYECYKASSLQYLRVHRNSPAVLLPSDIADSTVSASEVSDFEAAADIGETEFLTEVDSSSIGTWFGNLSNRRRADFAKNFANR